MWALAREAQVITITKLRTDPYHVYYGSNGASAAAPVALSADGKLLGAVTMSTSGNSIIVDDVVVWRIDDGIMISALYPAQAKEPRILLGAVRYRLLDPSVVAAWRDAERNR